MLSGREFAELDGISGDPVVIVNPRFATKFWPGQDAVGKRFQLFDGETPEAWVTVVGVAPNIVQNDYARQKIDPLVYLPYRQAPAGYMWVMARTSVPPGDLGTAFRREVQALDSDLPIFSLQTLAERLEENYRGSGRIAVLFLSFSAIALLLASIGLYAVIANAVSRRTQEIGIRMAIGATARDVLKLVFRQAMPPLGIGLIVGLATSFAVTRILNPLLVQVSPTDPIALGVAAAVLILAAMLGGLVPARRAIRTDPANAIRHE